MTTPVTSLSLRRLILAAQRKGHTNINGTGERGFYHGSSVSKKPLPDRLPPFLAHNGPPFLKIREGRKGREAK